MSEQMKDRTQAAPFRIAVPDAVLDDLQRRLEQTRWPSALEGVGWAYGTDIDYLRGLVDYWRRGYDWRAREAQLNALPHFRAAVDDLQIHFVHLRSSAPRTLPLLLVHGWPSSYLEMAQLAPLLTAADAAGVGFDLVIPSLPGFGFSDWPKRPGFGYRNAAQVLHRLMGEVLGYSRYGVHGSDVGGHVVGWMGLDDPQGAVVGIHTMQPSTPPPQLDPPARPLSAAERQFVDAWNAWEQEHGAYAHQQRTRPQTLAYSLNDTPVGLAAWIVEKLRAWSDCDGDVERRFSRDEILDLVMIYWTTETAPSSIRAYYERIHVDGFPPVGVRAAAPAAVTGPLDHPGQPPHLCPREYAERTYDVTAWTELPRGGHFASWEEPEAVAAPMRSFFSRFVPDLAGARP